MSDLRQSQSATLVDIVKDTSWKVTKDTALGALYGIGVPVSGFSAVCAHQLHKESKKFEEAGWILTYYLTNAFSYAGTVAFAGATAFCGYKLLKHFLVNNTKNVASGVQQTGSLLIDKIRRRF